MNGNNKMQSNYCWASSKDRAYGTWELNIDKCYLDEFIVEYILLTRKFGLLLPVEFTQNLNSTIDENYKFFIDYLNINQDLMLGEINFESLSSLYEVCTLTKQKIKFNPLFLLYSSSKIRYPRFSNVIFYYDNNYIIRKTIQHLVENSWPFDPNSNQSLLSNNLITGSCIGFSPFQINIRSNFLFNKIENKFFNGTNLKSINAIDNSVLARLNTPRFNSFLRSLKILLKDSDKSSLTFVNSEHPDLIKEGILLDGKLIYYEDIEDLLEDKYKIENLYKDLN
ncbi:MAG: hypothetical protein ACJATI_003861 [Halioglobus sp.]|jgi:hypothetical protein